ncbi:MAG: uroporphyrinogen decarboxylase, partial [Rhodobacteraceae bacterium]|nr:uroporphyrinogen decarboxylase [Paracoccaceae bacterium]
MKTAPMTKRERLKATLAGQPTDRAPVTFWHHFPDRDRTADELVDSTLAFQRRYDLDIVKVMPTGMFCALDYGARIALAKGDVG